MKAFSYVLFFVLCATACGAYVDESRKAQADAARIAQEIACKRHVERFRAGAAEGLTCEQSKARAAKENPLCPLTFECPKRQQLDGGAK
jgi:hypothetical protein